MNKFAILILLRIEKIKYNPQ